MTTLLPTTPKDDGFRVPPEFDRHWGCWMLWPERADVWRLGAKPAQKVFAEVAEAIAESEFVTVGVSEVQFENARARLSARIRVIEVSYNDAWCRDTGPTFVCNAVGEVRGIDWVFNAWGGLERGLYFPWDKDDRLARKIMGIERVDGYRAPLTFEGGALLVDGQGTAIVTVPTVVGTGKNAMSRAEAEVVLNRYLGTDKIIWLPRGVIGDETGGHIDVLCAFAAPGRLLLSWPDDRTSPQAEVAHEAFEILNRETDATGKRLEIIKVPEPPPLVITQEEAAGIDWKEGSYPRRAGDLVPATHINAYIANNSVILPVFGLSTDESAVRIYESAFPGRRIKPILSREIALGGGNIHCITQQVPLSKVQPWLGAD